MKQVSLFLLIAAVFLFLGCHKKVEPPMPTTAQSTTSDESEPMPPEVHQNQDLNAVEIDELTRLFQPIFFDYNRFEIRDDQTSALQTNVGLLRKYSTVNIILEGHCDERGTEEYNLALGERRAKAVRDYLISHGINANRLETISYGESRPFAEGHSEVSWQQNRRAQSVVIKAR
jgi:peptidoglycan-associated lipoprotein